MKTRLPFFFAASMAVFFLAGCEEFWGADPLVLVNNSPYDVTYQIGQEKTQNTLAANAQEDKGRQKWGTIRLIEPYKRVFFSQTTDGNKITYTFNELPSWTLIKIINNSPVNISLSASGWMEEEGVQVQAGQEVTPNTKIFTNAPAFTAAPGVVVNPPLQVRYWIAGNNISVEIK
jgi:hypothetical protein